MGWGLILQMGAGVIECGLVSDPPDGGRCDRMWAGSDPPDGGRCDRMWAGV